MASVDPQSFSDVFISYARSDERVARQLADLLRTEGFDVWFDAKIYAGAQWEQLLMQQLATAKAIVVLWSARSRSRPWVLKEARVALATGRLISVLIDDSPLRREFAAVQAVPMAGWTGQATHPNLEQLLSGISHIAPPSRVDNVRPGFDPAFLGPRVGFPVICGVADEFRYLHFSVIMNPGRRLAWYVAYNMRPAASVPRGDRWMPDPMLPAAFQPHNDHFRGTGYDRGHLVSPKTVSWGTAREAELANRQAFFWTNTAPQHPHMNQRWWRAVEQYEREIANSHDRALGFSGPVLAADDPSVREVEQSIGRLTVRQNFWLPRSFWKIVVVADSTARVRCAAFLLDQQALFETPRATVDAQDFRCNVAAIENATGLDFGSTLRSAAEV